ncbi:MAG TPA: tRNA lysidine(34) synthetase TilS, partial [Desulfuromonadales bacterium]|nr:tRNA lysidine(34) synthetase TilS [Desulfuromonadales bacterium]
MHDAFCQILRKQCLLAPHERVLVAVSGGVDSVVLLHLFASCAARFPLTVFAAHLDHGLRPESGTDADFVRALCERLEIPLVIERVEAAETLRAGDGLEAVARDLRRDFLRRTAARLGCGAIALGHHRDDQAETVLMRLLRGSGPTGLAAMRPRRDLFVRPLLAWPRSRLRSYLEEHDLPHVEDSSNADPLYTRNRLRHEVLPLLRTFNPALDDHLAQLAGQFCVEEAYWDGE